MSVSSLVVLAAGNSHRMGTHKALLECGDKVWLEELLFHYAKLSLNHCFLVVGLAQDNLLSRFPELRTAFEREVEFCALQMRLFQNPNPQLGPFSSMQIALRAWFQSNRSENSVLVTPVDAAPAPDSVMHDLENALKNGATAAMPEFAGKGGHPVLLTRNFVEGLLSLDVRSEDSRLDVQLHNLGAACARVSTVHSSVTFNLNAPADWQLFRSRNNIEV